MPLIRLNLGFRPWPRRSVAWCFDGPLHWPLKWPLNWPLDWPLLCRLGAITLSVTGAVSALTGNLQGLEWASLDQAFRWRPAEDQPSPILLVTIDEADLTELGRWPIDDRTVAQVLTTLKRHQPSAIGLDLYRNLPVEPGGAALRQVFTTTPNLIGIQKAVGDLQGPTIAGPALLSERGQVAANDLVLDADGKLRRNLLSIRYAGQPTQLALGTQLALIYLQQRHQILPQTLSQSGGDAAPLVLGRARLRRLRADEGGYRGIDVQGYQTLSNFLRVPQGIRRVSLRDVLADRVPPDHIRDQIVLIGSTAASLRGDRVYTPYSTNAQMSWAGVEVHANVAAQLISSALTGRALLQGWPLGGDWAWIGLWSGLGTTWGWRLRSLRGALIGPVLLMGGLVGSAYGLFWLGWWVLVASPALAFGGAAAASRGYWAWRALRRANQDLEAKVQARTQELVAKNADLAEAKQAAEVADRAKSLFLASMSHELRTPLTSILGFSELLAQTATLTAADRAHLQIINRSGEHLLGLINDVLTLAKSEADVAAHLEPMDLTSLVRTMIAMFTPAAAAQGLAFTVSSGPDLPTWIQTDRRKLTQILINLIGNAVKFTDRGTVTLAVTRQTAALTFAITDTGPGIAAVELPHLFAPFVQAAAGQQLQTGAGLGLAISHRLAQLLGGDLQATSVVGQGSRFELTLPLQIASPVELSPAELNPVELSPVELSPTALSTIAPTSSRSEVDRIWAEAQLTDLPVHWLPDLQAAALRLNADRCLGLIQQLPVAQSVLRATLIQYVDDSRFDRLLNLLTALQVADPASFSSLNVLPEQLNSPQP